MSASRRVPRWLFLARLSDTSHRRSRDNHSVLGDKVRVSEDVIATQIRDLTKPDGSLYEYWEHGNPQRAALKVRRIVSRRLQRGLIGSTWYSQRVANWHSPRTETIEGVFDPNSSTYEGVPIWKLRRYPGSNRPFGGEAKLAAYLHFNVEVGESFRIADLRAQLSEEDGGVYTASALERRWRSLKGQGWRYASYRDEHGLPLDTYRLLAKGNRVWLGERTRRESISAAVRRRVFERDLNRCVICGIGVGELYEDEPGSHARLTVGHRTAGARLADASPDNLQTECSRCNEPVGDVPPNPEVFDEVMASVSKLGATHKLKLLEWIESGRRHRDKLDEAFDRVRRLSESERVQVAEHLKELTGRRFPAGR